MLDYLQNLNYTSLAIISSVIASVVILWTRVLLKEIKTAAFLGINFFTSGAVLLLLSPFFYKFELSLRAGGVLILIALIDTAANYFYFKTFEKTEASIAAPILSLAPAFTFFFGWILLDERVGWYGLTLALLIIAAIVLFSADFKNFKNFNLDTLRPALLSSFLFGLSAIPTKYLLASLHATNAPTLYMFRSGLIALFALLFFRFSIREISVRQYRHIFLRSLLVIGQYLLFYYALSLGSAGITVTLANIAPAFVLLLGIIFLGERPQLKKALAAILILVLSLII